MSKPKRKIYIVGGVGQDYANWMEGTIVERMEDADLVVFTGGADISPELYGKKAHPTTSNNLHRDMYEIEEFKKARKLNKPIIGICRGAQANCVFSGGKLIQHSQHPYLHDVKTNDGRTIRVSSSHHQQQYILDMPPEDVELIAWAENLSPFHYGESNKDVMDGTKEVEIAYYPKTKALCIQSHPEYQYPPREDWEKEYIEYCRELIVTYLKV